MATRVKYVLQHFAYWSKTNGNSQWAHRVTRTSDGKSVAFKSPHQSNARGGVCGLSKDHCYPAILETEVAWLSYRDFNPRCEGLPYAGCTCENITAFLKKAFRAQKKA